MNTGPGRVVQEWAEWELALLEARYCLDGLAFIQGKTNRSRDSIRRKASNLDLSSEMRIFTSVADVAREAGVNPKSVWQWLDLHGYRRHCRHWGRELLMPLPAANLYLTRTMPRRVARPAGWWGVYRVAEALTCTPGHVHNHIRAGHLTAVSVRRTVFVEPHSVREYQLTQHAAQPRPNELRVRDLAAATGLHAYRDLKDLPRTMRVHPGTRPARYTTQDAARSFLTARGHREEMVETLLRKAILMQTARTPGKPGESQK